MVLWILHFGIMYLSFIADGYPDCDRPVFSSEITPEQAQRDLDAYNGRKRLERVADGGPVASGSGPGISDLPA